WLRPAAGDDPDELDAVLRGLDEKRLTLRHPALGDLEIDRARLLRLRPLFHGRRVELDNGTHRLGAAGRDGEYAFRLGGQPGAARLVVTLSSVAGRAELVLNGRVVEDLGRYVGRGATEPVRVPLPRDALRAGDNTVQLRVRDEAGRRGSCIVGGVALEV